MTDINNLINDIDKLKIESLEDAQIIIDECYNIKDKLEAIEYISKNYKEDIQEVIRKIIGIYELYELNSYELLLIDIVLKSTIDTIFKLECCKVIYQYNKSQGQLLIYKIYDKLYNIETPLKIEVCNMMLTNLIYLNENSKYIRKIFEDKIDIKYKFKILTTLKNNIEIDKTYKLRAYIYFIENHINDYDINIIYSIEYLISEFKFMKYIDLCISYGKNKNISLELRSNAIDLILRYGNKELGNELLKDISYDNKKINNIYTNKQNVHNINMEKSISKYLIETLNNIKINEKDIDIIFNLDKSQSFINSMNRILIDNSIYTGNQTLKTILLKIWKIIETSENKDLLKNRLIEELKECDGVCGTGYLSRIVNIMSAYGFTMNIGFEEQIKSNVFGRLNKMIHDIKDEKYKELILNELISEGMNTNLKKFYKDNIFKIYEELYLEYVGVRSKEYNEGVVKYKYIDHDTFELYFRNAVSSFEGN